MKRKSLRFKKKIKKLINDKGMREFYVNACLRRVSYKSLNSFMFNIINVKRAEHYSRLHYSFKKQTKRKQEYVYGLGLNGPVKVPFIRGGYLDRYI